MPILLDVVTAVNTNDHALLLEIPLSLGFKDTTFSLLPTSQEGPLRCPSLTTSRPIDCDRLISRAPILGHLLGSTQIHSLEKTSTTAFSRH